LPNRIALKQSRFNPKPGVANVKAPGFLRRLGAQIYDALLLLAVWFLATAIALPFNQGQAFTSSQWLYPLYLLAVSLIFYAWFWTHGGQTLGMRAWKIKVLNSQLEAISGQQAVTRFFTAGLSWLCLGLGFIWVVIDRQGLAWHDKLSNTRLVQLAIEKPGNRE
jgi:uncharacterized RDD family membrane protein YckC